MRRGFQILRIAALSGAAVSAFAMAAGVIAALVLLAAHDPRLAREVLAPLLIADRAAGALLLFLAFWALIEALGAAFPKGAQ